MRSKISFAAAAVMLTASIAARAGAQAPAQAPPQTPPAGQAPTTQAPAAPAQPQGGRAGAPAQPQGGRGGRGGNPIATFPAQQRALADPAVIARGNTLYGINCRLCHGVDLRGGEMGGPNLLRSQLVLNDQDGELIGPVILNGRNSPGMSPMPAIPMPVEDTKAVAHYIHSIVATGRGQGAPPAGPPIQLNILVGDANAGRTYFQARCSSCHSATGDLQGLATRIPDPVQLQNTWVGGGGGRGGRGGRGGGAPAAGPAGAPSRREVRAVVTQPNGQRVEGRLDRIDDFLVILTPADGVQRSFRRNGDVPRVEINDPLDGHKKLLGVYTDKDMHDVTAYLVTLK